MNRDLAGVIGIIALVVIGGLALMAIGGLVAMLLWNWIVPDVFPSVKEINFWQAIGIILLSWILFRFPVVCKLWKKGK